MSTSIPSFPNLTAFKACPPSLALALANYFDNLSNCLKDLNKSLTDIHQHLDLASSSFARNEISQFLLARSLTKSEYALSSTSEILPPLSTSLHSLASAIFDLLPCQENPDSSPTDFSTKH